jgi:signal peptidase I
MAAALAQYASSRADERQGPSPWVAAFLTVITPGLGHIYIGRALRGILFFCLIVAADSVLMFALTGVLARFWTFAISLALLLGAWLFIIIDASTRAARMSEHPRRPYNKPAVYLGAFALAWLITAGPFVYAMQAKASGQLGYFRATVGAMLPTVENGEYLLADATFYRARPPSRGEVAVYIHPKRSDAHYIRRIIAVEGDRVAIRAGHAIVNGIAVEEPYVHAGLHNAPFANMPEIRVPAGYVYVLGDNRADSEDSRDVVAHGPVPVSKLIGRVTDIALSHDLSRLGRWIGTPGHL